MTLKKWNQISRSHRMYDSFKSTMTNNLNDITSKSLINIRFRVAYFNKQMF